MKLKYLILLLLITIVSCSKKNHPAASENKTTVATHPATIKTRGPLPKVLTIDDKVAGRAVDGRLYFDLEGHRYWKNYKDGKYYMFSKSMYNNPAFKPK